MKTIPAVCDACKASGEYFGRLVFEDELPELPDEGPICPNHNEKEPQYLRPIIPSRSLGSPE